MPSLRRVWSTPITTGNTRIDDGLDRQRIFQELHDALIAVGLEQTADTGQLEDFSGVTGDATSVIEYGFRLYKFTDSIGSIYLRIGFVVRGSSSAGVYDVFDFNMSIGVGTSGSGVLLGTTPVTPAINRVAGTTVGASAFVVTSDVPSFAFAGEGIFWVALKCGSIIGGTSTSGAVGSPAPGINRTHTFLCVARTCGEDGLPNDTGFSFLSQSSESVSWGTSGSRLTFNRLAPHCHFIDGSSGIIRASRSPLGRPCADLNPSIGGSIAVSKVYGHFDTGVRQLYGVGSVPAIAVGSGDNMPFTLAGMTENQFIVPHQGLSGFADLSVYNASAFGLPIFDTPLLLWEGDFV
jgi:hypothetical protein